MTPTEAADFLRSYNKWRIFGGLKKPSPAEISKSFYAVIEMIDRLEAAENELVEIRHGAAVANDTIKALRAKIEAMERQEPVAWAATDETKTVVEALGMNQSRRFDSPLFLAPGAQPAPSVPDGWRLVPIEPTSEMLDKGSDQSFGYVSIALDVWAAMLAAAPEAKP